MPGLVPLLHRWTGDAPQKQGVFKLGDGVHIPADWQPKVSEYAPAAIPTPFARAEATQLILQRIGANEGAEQHELVVRFRSLLLGLTTGVLQLEPQDLDDERIYDNLGKALMQVDPEARYFARVVGRTPTGPVLFGATYRSCLAWASAHPRVDWNWLEQACQPRSNEGAELLADWKESLRRAGRWRPELCAWQRGIDHVIATATPTPNLERLHEHCRFIGPITVTLPTGAGDEMPSQLIYLPTIEPKFAKRFYELLQYEPKLDSDRNIVFKDVREERLGAINFLPAREKADALALGSGALWLAPAGTPRQPPASQREWNDKLRELLKPLHTALEEKGRSCDPAQVQRDPALYPDPLRLLSREAGPAGIQFTHRARQLVRQAGVQLPAEDSDDVALVELSVPARSLRIALIDRLGDLEILDLRALGLILYCLFNGEAVVRSDLGGNVTASQDAVDLVFDKRDPMLVQSDAQPLEPMPWVYGLVRQQAPEAVRKRLALLQRFVATYSAQGAGGEPGLLSKAAWSFARWAYGGEVLAQGKRGNKDIVLPIPVGFQLTVARDAFR